MNCKKLAGNFFRLHWWSYLLGLVLLVATNLLVLSIPKLLGKITDAIAHGHPGMDTLSPYLWALVGLSFVIFVIRFIWRFFLMGNARLLEVYLRDHLFRHLQSLPVSFYTERKTGDLVAYAINDVQALRMALGPGTLQAVDGLMVAGISIAFMAAVVNPLLLVLTLSPLILAIGLLVSLAAPIRNRFKKVQESFSNLSDKVQESIAGIRVIKSFAQENATVRSFGESGRNRVGAQVRLVRVSALLGPGIQVCFGLSFLIFIIFGSGLVRAGSLSVGDFVAANLYIMTIMGPVASISRVIELCQKGLASYQRLNELFAVEPVPGPAAVGPEPEMVGALKVRGLTFRYPGADQDALTDISLETGPGKVIGIIGPTGSGKTTLVSLLLRLHPVEDGTISIDGRDINDIPLSTLRESIGYVPQDHFLFSTTIRNNIEFFRPDYTDEEIEEATKQSGIFDSIAAFPEGFDTQVGERGVTLSGGQKQRISIARALVKDPAILILDDSLSAVDTRTEAQILTNFRTFLADRTGIIISHRVSTVQLADEILVLEEGRIADRGTHDQLASRPGLYSRWCGIQEVAP